ncbi:MAG: MBL fold hydrolase [Bacteroidetes bacterium]|nr:MAG: MBL fold hydrolase [Bacteroidota bacterium]
MGEHSQLLVETFPFNDFSENTYVLYVPEGDAYLIDVGCRTKREWAELRDFVDENGLHVVGLLNTHAHLDHMFGIEWARRHWNAPFMLHPADNDLVAEAPRMAAAWGVNMPPVGAPDAALADGQELAIGGDVLRVVTTPGHTPGGVCFYLPGMGLLFSGDTLFSRSVGRTDLPGGDYDTLLTGIRDRLLTLPDETVVLPGHGPRTTIGDERELNPFLG